VDFRTGDAQALPFDEGEFDVAAMALVINFVSDPPQAVAEMKRVVAPGGTVGSYIWDFAGGRVVQEPLIKAIKEMGIGVPSVPRTEYSRADKLREMFVAAGLEEVTERTIEIQIEFADFDEFWSSQTGLVTPAVEPIMAMSSGEVDELKAALRERLTANEDVQIRYAASVNAIKGRVAA
jgi:ubiquinone/menaquinone biosynthesis C-methylase UbiE